MTWVIAKRELRNYLKNPVYYIGILVVLVMLYQSLSPYLNLHLFESGYEEKLPAEEDISDADVFEGFIPTSEEEQYDIGLELIKNVFIEHVEMTEEEAGTIISDIKDLQLTIPETCRYLEEHHSYYGAQSSFWVSQVRPGTAEELNEYIQSSMDKETYTYYFSRKYADYCGLFIILFEIILLAFLFIHDMKKDMYELLHAKPVKSWQYIIGKTTGGMLAMLVAAGFLTTIFDILCMLHGISQGFPVSPFDIWSTVFLYILPSLFMVAGIYTGISLLFKTPVPAVPLLLLYLVYSNMGSVGPDGQYDYYGRIFSILFRVPGRFFETALPPMAFINRILLLAAGTALTILGTYLWKRRRVY